VTPEAQRIAIAEACGWKLVEKKFPRTHGTATGYRYEKEDGAALSGGGLFGWGWAGSQQVASSHLPDYLNDLNAMHEAEKTLDSKPVDERSMYYDFLLLVTPGWPPWLPSGEPPDSFEMDWKIVRATAAQRAEAFLRTIGKWVD